MSDAVIRGFDPRISNEMVVNQLRKERDAIPLLPGRQRGFGRAENDEPLNHLWFFLQASG